MSKTKKTSKVTQQVVEDTETPVKKVVRRPFHVEIKANDKVFGAKGKDFTEAISQVIADPNFPVYFKTKVVVTYGKNDAVRNKIMGIPEARRVFNVLGLKPVFIEVLAKKFDSSIASF